MGNNTKWHVFSSNAECCRISQTDLKDGVEGAKCFGTEHYADFAKTWLGKSAGHRERALTFAPINSTNLDEIRSRIDCGLPFGIRTNDGSLYGFGLSDFAASQQWAELNDADEELTFI